MNARVNSWLQVRSLSLSLLAALAAGLVQAQQQAQPGAAPMARASVDELVAALSNAPATRSFRRTPLPDAGSNVCAAKPAAAQGRPAGAASSAQAHAGSAGNSRTVRTLEVVPYAGDATPGVNLQVQFTVGSDKLATSDRQLLDTLAAALNKPELAGDSFAIAGHTDSSGDARVNLELSCARALAVQRYLQSKGVAAVRLSAYGFGSARPLEGRQPSQDDNRRVEVRKAPQ